MLEFFENLGYFGMFLSAIIAGSVFPLSSETVLGALQVAGLNPFWLFIWASIGNVMGSMFNYWVGRQGRLDWITKYLHIKEKSLQKTQKFMEGKGAWIGVLAWIPILGSGITVMLGYTRASVWMSVLSITVGKVGRYIFLIWLVKFFT